MVSEKPKRKPFRHPALYFGAGVIVTLLVGLLVFAGLQPGMFSSAALPLDAMQASTIAQGVLDAALSPAGDALALLAWKDGSASLTVHDLRAERSLSEDVRFSSAGYSAQSRLMFAPDGSRLLVSSSDSGQTALLDAVTGTSLQNFSAQAGAFLPDGTLVIVNGSTLLHIHADGSTTLAEIQLAFDGNCYRMAVSPDGSRVALASANDSGSEVWIYGIADWKPLPRSHSAPDRIQALAFAPGASHLALTHENGALVLDLEGSSTQSYMFENQGMARAVSFSPQGDLLAVAGDAGWLYVVRWAASDVIPPSEDYFMPMLLSGHQQDIHALSFTADGLLLSASRDGSVRLWDPVLQQEISRLQI